jgi:hypothetical protein
VIKSSGKKSGSFYFRPAGALPFKAGKAEARVLWVSRRQVFSRNRLSNAGRVRLTPRLYKEKHEGQTSHRAHRVSKVTAGSTLFD